MFRIDNSTSVAALPVTPPAGTGGYFTNGNPIAAQPATVVDDWWTNTVQEEIVTVVVNAGLTLNKNDRTQLYQAIQHLIGIGVGSGEDYDPFLPLVGGTLHAGASSDLLTMQVDNGYYARIRYVVAGVRLWLAGADNAGNFVITDGTAGVTRLWIDPAGTVITPGHATINGGANIAGATVTNAITVSGGGINADGVIWSGTGLQSAAYVNAASSILAGTSVIANGAVSAKSGNLYLGTSGYVLYESPAGTFNTNASLVVNGPAGLNAPVVTTTFVNVAQNINLSGSIQWGAGANALQFGSGWLIDYGNFQVTGLFSAAGNGQFNSNLGVAGNLTVGTSIIFGNGADLLQWSSAGALVNYGNFSVTGNIAGNASLTVTGNIFAQSPSAGGVYCNGLTADVFGLTSRGNLRFIGGAQPGAANSITWENMPDTRPYALSAIADRIAIYDANISGGGVVPVNRWFSVFVGGVEVGSGGQGYKAGGGMWADGSERRLKEDIEDYATGLDVVSRLQPRSYKFNGQGGTTANGKTYFGLIADEVEDVMPEMLGQMERDGETITTVDSTALVYALVNSVRELAGRVATLEGRA